MLGPELLIISSYNPNADRTQGEPGPLVWTKPKLILLTHSNRGVTVQLPNGSLPGHDEVEVTGSLRWSVSSINVRLQLLQCIMDFHRKWIAIAVVVICNSAALTASIRQPSLPSLHERRDSPTRLSTSE